MEGLLKTFFDYQRFFPDRDMETMIKETEIRYPKLTAGIYPSELSEDILNLVHAAGEIDEIRIVEKKGHDIK